MKTLEEARVGLKETNVAELKGLRPDLEELPSLTGLRSAAWKECLLFEGSEPSQWPLRLAESRSAYNALRAHFLRAIEHPDELGSAVDPLTDSQESPWDALRRDEALRTEIFQDVERCMPENVYFRQPATQNMLLDILFVFCKLNPDVGYRQGMHELLAPIVWVVERDALDTRHWKTTRHNVEEDSLLFDLLDQRYIEHDAFTLFGLIMQNAKAFYEPGTEQPKRAGGKAVPECDAPILLRIKRIYNRYLPEVDPELASHLLDLDLVPQVFLMRWIRLLFGREFPFDDTVEVWDALLAVDPNLDLVDYICVAMLLRIRWELLEADSNMALTLLLRYPQPSASSPPRSFVKDALYVKQNLNPSGGAHIIEKHSRRRPSISHHAQRPSTPLTPRASAATSSPRQNRSPLASPSRLPSGIGTPNLGLEGLLSDAARAAYTRGEKWGLNRAVRGAVGEVRKNVSAIGNSPRNSMHRRTSSADLIRRCEKLEQRNKALAGMLETALGELWECQKTFAEAKDAGDSNKGEQTANQVTSADQTVRRNSRREAVDALGMAIAKVQFVQVYLGDATMPLPIDDSSQRNRTGSDVKDEPRPSSAAETEKSSSIEAALADAVSERSGSSATGTISHEPKSRRLPEPNSEVLFDAAAEDADAAGDAARFETLNGAPEGRAATPSSPIPIHPQSQSRPSIVALASPQIRHLPAKSPPTTTTTPTLATPPPQPSSSAQSRPSLEQSSFSWMLGHGAEDRHHAFAAALSSPFGSEDSGARRTADKGKAFLFGDGDDDAEPRRRGGGGGGGGGDGIEAAGRGLGAGRGKRRSMLLRKKPQLGSGVNGGRADGKRQDGSGHVDQDINLSAFSSG